jgi:hypothetical protein
MGVDNADVIAAKDVQVPESPSKNWESHRNKVRRIPGTNSMRVQK